MVITRHKFSTADYHQMIEIGILDEDDRVELIEGEIVKMAAIGSRHAGCTKKSNIFFQTKLGNRVIIGVQDPIALEDGTEPEPDIALLRPKDHFYATSHPRPPDIFFILEIADTSLLYDKEVKLVKYAQAGIPESWLLDLTSDTLLIHRNPSAKGYQDTHVLKRGQSLSLLAFPDVVVRVDDLLALPLR